MRSVVHSDQSCASCQGTVALEEDEGRQGTLHHVCEDLFSQAGYVGKDKRHPT